MELDAHTAEEAVTQVHNTLATYCHAIDDGRFDEFAACFAASARVTVMGQTIEGRDAIRTWMEQAMPPERRGRHVTSNTRITVDRDRASAVSDFMFYANGSDGWRVTQVGRYLDELVEIDGRWCFAERQIVLGAQPLE